MAKHWKYYSDQDKQTDPDYGTDIIAKERYVSKEFMDLEVENIWKKVCLMGGPLLDLQNPGDYITTEILGEPILISMGDDNKIRAFYNVCQHRGNRLVHSIKGNNSDERIRRISVFNKLLSRPELGALGGSILVLVFFGIVAGNSGMFSAYGMINFLEVSAYLGIIAVFAALLMIGGEFVLSV